ncbi:DDE-type integrase/transposase/recombinase [Rhodoferax sp.]|uniref:DDE-type integrase/transposase/recombinase n=2 Tax=Rhodoferax sp. TaxID=50421 RepID=UPI0025FDD0EC|nr:DDE-type integrase/transposase/recombinase [Rhodoferax sp.]
MTTQHDVRQLPGPDLVNRAFAATEINQLWVADMTYIPTWSGILYRSVVIDIFSRKVVGWAFGERMTAGLATLALNMALMTRKPASAIHRFDQGSNYTSIALGNRCKELGVRPSMSSVGDTYYNAMAESLFASLEYELIATAAGRSRPRHT